MDKCESLFEKHNIKPVVGVIPNNKDKELLSYPKEKIFGILLINGKKLGNRMHGYTHLYDTNTNKKDYFNYGGRSRIFWSFN